MRPQTLGWYPLMNCSGQVSPAPPSPVDPVTGESHLAIAIRSMANAKRVHALQQHAAAGNDVQDAQLYEVSQELGGVSYAKDAVVAASPSGDEERIVIWTQVCRFLHHTSPYCHHHYHRHHHRMHQHRRCPMLGRHQGAQPSSCQSHLQSIPAPHCISTCATPLPCRPLFTCVCHCPRRLACQVLL